MKITVNKQSCKKPIKKGTKEIIKKIAFELLKKESKIKKSKINILLADNKSIKKINLEFLKINKPTDVIAFNLSKNKYTLNADIIISTETAASNAKKYNTNFYYELFLYVAHGILHTLGFDDKTKKETEIMFKKANLTLAACGITNKN